MSFQNLKKYDSSINQDTMIKLLTIIVNGYIMLILCRCLGKIAIFIQVLPCILYALFLLNVFRTAQYSPELKEAIVNRLIPAIKNQPSFFWMLGKKTSEIEEKRWIQISNDAWITSKYVYEFIK